MRVALFLVMACLACAPVDAAIIQWQVADGGNGHYYELVGDYNDPAQRWNWQDAKVLAESREHLGMFGHLVTITSAAEDLFIVSLHADSKWPTWIGLTDSEDYGGSESFGQTDPLVDG